MENKKFSNEVVYNRTITDVDHPYFCITQKLFEDSRLNATEIGVLILILNNSDSYVFNKEYFQTRTGLGNRIYNNTIKNLQKFGYLTCIRFQRGCKWIINDSTIVTSNTDKSNTDKSNTDKSNTDKSNTDKSNTDKSNTITFNTVTSNGIKNDPLINNKEINNKEINNKEINNKEINNKEINNKDINNKDINNILVNTGANILGQTQIDTFKSSNFTYEEVEEIEENPELDEIPELEEIDNEPSTLEEAKEEPSTEIIEDKLLKLKLEILQPLYDLGKISKEDFEYLQIIKLKEVRIVLSDIFGTSWDWEDAFNKNSFEHFTRIAEIKLKDNLSILTIAILKIYQIL